jgi:hypothetical protein
MRLMPLYYSDGGPGPATLLLRINVDGNGSDAVAWRKATADKWTARGGWQPAPNAQLDIAYLGEYFMVDASEVPKIQNQMREQAARYGPR